MTAQTEIAGAARSEAQLRRLVERATALEADGDLDGAVNVYEEGLLAGLASDEICYNLALLYKQQLLFEDALTLLGRCLDSPEYGASAHYASGECELALAHFAAAGDHFDNAVRRIALDQVTDEQVEEVAHIFRVAIDTFTSLDRRDRADQLAATLQSFLDAHGAGEGEAPDLDAPPAAPPAAPDPTAPAPDASAPLLDAPMVERPVRPATGPIAPGTGPLPDAQPDRGRDSLLGTGSLNELRQTGRLTGTGRLRSVYRRLTDPAERITGSLSGTGQLARRGAAPAAEQAADAPQRPASKFSRRPVRVTPTAPLAGETSQPAEVRVLLSRSAADAQAGHYDAVVDACLRVLVLAPDYLPVHVRLAEAYAGLGLIPEATAKCRQLIQVYEARDEPLATIPIYRLLGALDPDDLTPWVAMADLYFTQGGDPAFRADVRALVARAEERGEPELARDYAQRLVSQDPGDVEARRLAAGLELQAGDPASALTHYQALLRRDRDDMLALAGVSIALTATEGAIHWPSLERLVTMLRGAPAAPRAACVGLYQRIIPTMESASGNLHLAAGLALLALGDAPEATAHLQAAQHALGAEADPRARFALAYALRQACAAAGDGASERQWLQRASDLLKEPDARRFAEQTQLFGEPVVPGTLPAALAESLVGVGKIDHAVAILEGARAILPDDALVRHRLAELYRQQGRLGQALDDLDELANRQLQAGKLAEMAETLRQMSRLAGENLTVKARLADLFLKRGFPDEALRELRETAEVYQRAGRFGDAAEALHRAADTAWIIGQRDEAYALYDRVLALAPEDVGLRQAYINCLLQGGRQKDAADQQWAIARTFMEQRKVQDTIAALHQVIVLDPRDAAAYTQLGEALASVGEYAQAERVYRRLVRLTPDDPLAKARQTAMAMLAKEQRG